MKLSLCGELIRRGQQLLLRKLESHLVPAAAAQRELILTRRRVLTVSLGAINGQ